MIGMTVDYVYALCRRNEIPHIPLGRSYRFRIEGIERWLAHLERGLTAKQATLAVRQSAGAGRPSQP
jgi:excisionase family DNA binding protein